MEITEVRVKLVERSSERLRAFCSITLDGDFVIRDLKIIDGANGAFVAMPSRKLADRCPRCGCKNHLRARFCNDCGVKLNENRAPKDGQGRAKLHADVAHPINAECRERIQKAVVEAFEAELERSKSPDYKPPKFDDFDDYEDFSHEEVIEPVRPVREPQPPAPAADVEEEELVEEPVSAPGEEDEGAFSDYNSLIAELKRDAESRRTRHEESRPGGWQPRERREGARPPRDEGRHQGGRPSEGRPGGRPPRKEGGPRGEPRLRREAPAQPAPPPPPPPRPVRPAPPAAGFDDFAADLDLPTSASAPPRPQRPSPPPRPVAPPPPPPPARPVPPPPRPASEDDDFAAGL